MPDSPSSTPPPPSSYSSAPPPPPPNAGAWQPRQAPKKKNNTALWIILGVIGCFGLISFTGCFAAILIPNFMDALQKAKQKRSVADARNVGVAYMSYYIDNASGDDPFYGELPEVLDVGEGSVLLSAEELTELLVPTYIAEVPPRDGWEGLYEFWVAQQPGNAPGLTIRSAGRDGVFQGDVYAKGSYEPNEYDNDIVWSESELYYWPTGAR